MIILQNPYYEYAIVISVIDNYDYWRYVALVVVLWCPAL